MRLRNYCFLFYTAPRYANALYAVIVFLSVRPSQVGVLPRWLNSWSRKQRCTVAQAL